MAITKSGSRSFGDRVVKIAMTRQSWITGGAHGALSETAYALNGTLTRFDVIASAVTDNPTIAVTFRDQNSCILIPDALCATLADGTSHIKLARSYKSTKDADFNPVPLCDSDVTISIDPSADPGGSGQTLTVDLILYLE